MLSGFLTEALEGVFVNNKKVTNKKRYLIKYFSMC